MKIVNFWDVKSILYKFDVNLNTAQVVPVEHPVPVRVRMVVGDHLEFRNVSTAPGERLDTQSSREYEGDRTHPTAPGDPPWSGSGGGGEGGKTAGWTWLE